MKKHLYNKLINPRREYISDIVKQSVRSKVRNKMSAAIDNTLSIITGIIKQQIRKSL